MRSTSCLVLAAPLLALIARPAAAAAPDDRAHLYLAAASRPCPQRGAVCVRAVPPTIVDASLLASAAEMPSAPLPAFTRARNDDDTPWTLELDANLRRTAWAGNALFVLYDAEDAQAIENHEVTALYQAPIGAVRALSARLTLEPNDGFRPAHSYLLRIVQLIDGNEVVLAEGPIVLR